MKKQKGIAGALMEMERLDAIAKAEGYPVCKCGWPSDDPELDVCCDCADEMFMKQMLRGVFGKAEQAEARASAKSGRA